MSTEIATAPAKAPATLRAHLEGDAFKAAVARALPPHMKPERNFTSLSRPQFRRSGEKTRGTNLGPKHRTLTHNYART